MKLFQKKNKEMKKDQIIELAEKVIHDSGFTGIVEEDFKTVETTKEKQAFLIETLLYKYEHASLTDKPAIQKKLHNELKTFTKLVYEEPKEYSPNGLYEKVLKLADDKPADQTIIYKGEEVRITSKICGEYYNGEGFTPVKAISIYLNGECLYSDMPTQGVWSCATNRRNLKLVNVGTFEDPMDALGYIDYCTGGY